MIDNKPFFIFDEAHWEACPAEIIDQVTHTLEVSSAWPDKKPLDEDCIAWCDLPFYPSCKLIRVKGLQSEDSYDAYFVTADADDTLIYLDGSNSPIHALNAQRPPELNEQTVFQYLMFFCFFLHGGEGPFLVVESLDNPMITENEECRTAVAPHFQPMTGTFNEDDQSWQLQIPVLYATTLFRVDFQVELSGSVQMITEFILTQLNSEIYQPKKLPRMYQHATGANCNVNGECSPAHPQSTET